MQISNIAEVASSKNEWAAATRQPRPAVQAPSTDAPQAAPALATAAAPSIKTPPPSTAPLNTAVTVPVPSLIAQYSTTVAGKNYPLSVEESAGIYVASVPNPPGATATGSSPQSAEINLDMKLDTLA